MKLSTLLSPAELPALAQRDLRATVCVVFDILRATSTFVTALQRGAQAIQPVCEIAEANEIYARQPDVLLAGERQGVKIRATRAGERDFDLGNSPREFTPEIVQGRTIVSTTTNGTRALQACRGAQLVLAGSFLNLAATACYLKKLSCAEILFVCAGTGEGVALEDVLAAGALAELLATSSAQLSDATVIAQEIYRREQSDLAAALGRSQNGRRLLSLPELADDVAFCAQRDCFDVVPVLNSQGRLVRSI
jgi:2-phosphosulfolactate phosphatase